MATTSYDNLRLRVNLHSKEFQYVCVRVFILVIYKYYPLIHDIKFRTNVFPH